MTTIFLIQFHPMMIWQQIKRMGPLGLIILVHAAFLYALQSGLLPQATQAAFPKEIYARLRAPAVRRFEQHINGAIEFLFRRLSVEDAAEAHVVALAKAKEIGFDTFIVSSMTPFSREDRRDLIVEAPSVVARYFPDYPTLYAKRDWTMFDSIDRVYDAGKAARKLGFTCKTGFREVLDSLR